MLNFYVYILKCSDDSFYTGHTDNLEKRLSEHANGAGSGYTKTRLPIKCVFTEVFSTRAEALIAERKIKGWTKKKKLALISDDWDILTRIR